MLSIFSLLAGCSNSSVRPELPPESLQHIKQQASSDQTAESLITQYETKLKTFDPQLLAFYSPANFQAAQFTFSKATEEASNASASEADTKQALQIALAFLDRAQFTKKAVELHLKSANMHYQELLKLNAPERVPELFKQVKHSFSTLISEVEKEAIQDAISDQAELIEAMIKVEIQTLKQIHLQEAESFLQNAQKLNAKKYVADLYEDAAQKIAQTHALIDKSFRDRSAIKNQSLAALDAARRCYFVSKEAQKIDDFNTAELGKFVADNFKLIETLFLTTGKATFIANDYPVLTEELLSHIRRYEESTGQLKIDHEALLAAQAASKMKTQVEPGISGQSISENSLSKQNTSDTTGFAPGAVVSKPVPFPSKSASEFAEEEDSFDSIEYMKK